MELERDLKQWEQNLSESSKKTKDNLQKISSLLVDLKSKDISRFSQITTDAYSQTVNFVTN